MTFGKALFATCTGKDGKYNSCGQSKVLIANKSTMQCHRCNEKRKNDIKSCKPKIKNWEQAAKALDQLRYIQESKEYYMRAIMANIQKNHGKCLCDNCDERINHPTGSNVSHIIGAGANKTLYHDDENHFILGNIMKGDRCNCEQLFSDEGKRQSMRIYPLFVERWERLNNKYYTKKTGTQ